MTTSRKKTILKYRVTFLEMNNRPSFSYPSLPIKNVLLLESIDVSLWYFISLYKEIGYRYEWTDIFKQSSTKTNDFIKNKDVNFFSLLHKGTPIGFFILDYRNFNICELSYIGITNEYLGKVRKFEIPICNSLATAPENPPRRSGASETPRH